MTIRLRGHHLLCMLTYVGKGYSPAFTLNFDAIAERLSRGEDILLIEGPDDICSPLLTNGDAHCMGSSVKLRDDRALAALSHILMKPLKISTRLRFNRNQLVQLRMAFTHSQPDEGSIRHACIGCDWAPLCTDIAQDGYPAARLNL